MLVARDLIQRISQRRQPAGRAARCLVQHPAGRLRRHRRAIGKRQDDAARPARRSRYTDARPGAPRRRRPDGDETKTSAPSSAARKLGSSSRAFNSSPTLTALENVQVPLELRGDTRRGRPRARAAAPRRARRPARPLPDAALRRRTAARGDRARVRERAAHSLRRRADGKPRQRHRRAHRRAARGAQPRVERRRSCSSRTTSRSRRTRSASFA